jgi:hypothetical protein
MKVRIKYKEELKRTTEEIEVAYLSLYPNKGFDTADSDPICFLELKEAQDGSRVRHIDLTEVENLWFRDEAP